MPLPPGTRIGAYEITAPLGAGGMGEVYRAKDSKLKREVALKVLPADVANDRERLARFQREAEVLAALNHPNIAHIHGLEESGGTIALVMELVEGEDLAERLKRGAIPLDEALPIARQIAEALEAAHEQGIIHRDLKPANIKVRPDGTVKVLDFGLAKALDTENSRGGELANSPTITSPAMTERGVILGTAGYMSPEQARGKAVDKRADIWAFGCVLYEMLTGRRAFDGETLTDVLGAVVRAEPDWTRLPAGTPPAVKRVLTRCLRKDSARRLRHIGDAAIELTELEPAAVAAVPSATARPARIASWIAAAVVVTGLAGAAWMAGRATTPAPADDLPIRASLALPPNTTFSGAPSVSPDGHRIVAPLLDDKGQVQLWQRSLTASEFRPVANTTGVTAAFWSPDSQWIAFVSSGQLRRIDVAGDNMTTIAQLKVRGRSNGAWGADGTILVVGDERIWKVSANGGDPEPATSLDPSAGERRHSRPSFVGDTQSFVFEAETLGPLKTVKLASLDDAATSTLLVDNALIRQSAVSANYLLFKTASTLFAQPIDLAGRKLVGTPQRIQEEGLLSDIVPTVSPLVLAHIDGWRVPTELQWRDRSGRLLGSVIRAGDLDGPDLSPVGDRLAYATVNPATGRSELVVTGVADGRTSVVVATDGVLDSPIWSPDGQEIAYMAFEKNASGVYRKRLDSNSPAERLIDGRAGAGAPSDWTAHGNRLIWKRNGVANDVMMLPLSGTQESVPLVSSPAFENTGKVSPDGRWLAYSSDESGREEVYVQPFPDGGRRWQVSRAGGAFPRWRADGRELFFYAGNTLAAADIALGSSPRIGDIASLFTFWRRGTNANVYPYAVTPDGQRFIVNARVDQSPLLSIVVNWQAALKASGRNGAGR
ncbi:MAG: protein kinase [Acidobacteriota bacterium]|nr:protein kinase [Acidobacteriota bacterium]